MPVPAINCSRSDHTRRYDNTAGCLECGSNDTHLQPLLSPPPPLVIRLHIKPLLYSTRVILFLE